MHIKRITAATIALAAAIGKSQAFQPHIGGRSIISAFASKEKKGFKMSTTTPEKTSSSLLDVSSSYATLIDKLKTVTQLQRASAVLGKKCVQKS